MITIYMLSVTGIYMVKHMIYLYVFFCLQFNPLLFDIILSYREKFILYKNNKVVKNICLMFLIFAINTVILNNDIINIFRATKISGKKCLVDSS